jgi:hypothetical protein
MLLPDHLSIKESSRQHYCEYNFLLGLRFLCGHYWGIGIQQTGSTIYIHYHVQPHCGRLYPPDKVLVPPKSRASVHFHCTVWSLSQLEQHLHSQCLALTRNVHLNCIWLQQRSWQNRHHSCTSSGGGKLSHTLDSFDCFFNCWSNGFIYACC